MSERDYDPLDGFDGKDLRAMLVNKQQAYQQLLNKADKAGNSEQRSFYEGCVQAVRDFAQYLIDEYARRAREHYTKRVAELEEDIEKRQGRIAHMKQRMAQVKAENPKEDTQYINMGIREAEDGIAWN